MSDLSVSESHIGTVEWTLPKVYHAMFTEPLAESGEREVAEAMTELLKVGLYSAAEVLMAAMVATVNSQEDSHFTNVLDTFKELTERIKREGGVCFERNPRL